MNKAGKVVMITVMVALAGVLLYILFGILPGLFYVEVTPEHMEAQEMNLTNYRIEQYIGDQLTAEDIRHLFVTVDMVEGITATGSYVDIDFDENGITSKTELRSGATYKATIENYDDKGFISLIKIVEN